MTKALVIVGATGKVGRAVLHEMWPYLVHRDCPIDDVRLYASERSLGDKLRIPHRNIAIEQAYAVGMLHPYDHVVFCTPRPVTESFMPHALSVGCETVIDVSDAQVPDMTLCIEGVTHDELRSHKGVFGVMKDTEIDDVAEQITRVLVARLALQRAHPDEWHIRRRREGPPPEKRSW